MTTEITATVSAVATNKCAHIMEHVAVAYWTSSVHKANVGYHLNAIDENFRQLAEVLGYRVESIKAEEPPTDALTAA